MANKLGLFSDPTLDRQIEELVSESKKPTILEPGVGIVVTTPDGTKHYRIRVDNAGNVTTDLVTL